MIIALAILRHCKRLLSWANPNHLLKEFRFASEFRSASILSSSNSRFASTCGRVCLYVLPELKPGDPRPTAKLPCRVLSVALTAFIFGISSIPVNGWGFQANSVQQAETPTPPEATTEEFQEAAPPPVKRIIMFNSGLSQIVHEGTLNDSRRVNMRFSEHDVDDVLKSLVFEDFGGGTVRSVEYNPAPDNQDVAAQNLGAALTLAQTLQKYRGESVTIKTETGELRGSILSVENRQTESGFVETLTVVNDSGFVSLPINEFQSINFENEKIRTEFQLAMAGLQKTRLANSKEISLLFNGKGKRRVRYAYNVDSPIWRMTYRLDLKKPESILQGWAHIDNVTGVDWKEIQLDLRSGRPQSFHAEVFAPVLAERMSVPLSVFDVPTDKTLSTKAMSGISLTGEYEYDDIAGGGYGGFGGGGFGGGGFGGGGLGGGDSGGNRPKTNPADISKTFRSRGSVGRSNQMVRFAIEEPVSIGAGRSAMVPILKNDLKVELQSMFEYMLPWEHQPQDVPSPRQWTAVLVAQVTNETTTPMIPGPVTLYQQGDFVGDAAMGRVEVGQSAEIEYGSDLAVQLRVDHEPKSKIVKKVRLDEKGRVKVDSTAYYRRTFTLSNNDTLPRKFLVKIGLDFENVLPAPYKTEGKIGHYIVDAKPNSENKLTIEEKTDSVTLLTLRSIGDAEFEAWKKDKSSVDPAIQKRLAEYREVNKSYQAIVNKRSAIIRQIQEIETEQKRITDLLRVLEADTPIVKKYLERLESAEEQLLDSREKLKSTEPELERAKNAVARF